MPRKARDLIADLTRAGFVNRGGKGSHRNFEHPFGIRVTVLGREGDDAKHYQKRELSLQLARLKARRKGDVR